MSVPVLFYTFIKFETNDIYTRRQCGACYLILYYGTVVYVVFN